MTNRYEALRVISDERDYQEYALSYSSEEGLDVADFLLYIERLLVDAKQAECTKRGSGIEEIRKIGGLAVAAMELVGAPPRTLSERAALEIYSFWPEVARTLHQAGGVIRELDRLRRVEKAANALVEIGAPWPHMLANLKSAVESKL